MRLTLRTMLAYLDDILEPADAQDIQKKIDESEFATNLMHRMRDVTRRLRLAAPKLEGRGMGLDPNTVAEYLDNTLPGERVPDFEKVCLESDVHLAEVVSAHQILALVLGEPAEVNPGMRERMYTLTPKVVEPIAVASPVPPPVEDAKPRIKPEVPDYLREHPKRRTRASLAVAVVLLVIIGGGVLAVLNSPWFKERNRGTVAELLPKTATSPEGTSAGSATPAPDTSAATPEVPTETAPATINPGGAPTTPPNTTSIPPLPLPELSQPPATTTGVVAPENANPTIPPAPAVPLPGTPPTLPAAMPAMPATMPAAALPPVPATDSGAPMPPLPVDVATTPPADSPDKASVTTTTTTTPDGPEAVGRLISDHEVLLRFNPTTKTWQRLSNGATIFSGDKLLCLPTYRASLNLLAGVSVQLRGGTEVEMLGNDAQGVPGIRVKQGRLVVLTVGKPKAQIRVVADDLERTVTFGDGDSIVAFDFARQRVEGTNPEEQPAPLLVDLFVTSGEITWSDATRPEGESIRGPARRTIGLTSGTAPAQPASAADFPLWITGDDRTPIEKRASIDLEEAVKVDQPVSLKLKELADDRRIEISSLAVRCLALVDEFDSFVRLLQDPSQRSSWNKQVVPALRAAIAESPATATKVRETFVNLRGDKGLQLYRMLWGYSNEQLSTGDAAMLVEWLDHADLDFRVLAFWNLNHLSGVSLYYQPENTEVARRQSVIKWKQRLEAGQITAK